MASTNIDLALATCIVATGREANDTDSVLLRSVLFLLFLFFFVSTCQSQCLLLDQYQNGECYHGYWCEGKRHGLGTLHLSNTEVFDGGWNDNKKNGIGLYFWIDGEVDVSLYHNDVRVESIRWSKDRRSSFFLDLKQSKKSDIALSKATEIVRGWETDQQRVSFSVAGSDS